MKLPRIPLLTQVSGAHLVSHLHLMALPAVLPLLPGQLGVGYVELGLALSIFNVVSALVQAPLGFAVDRFGARRVLTFGLLIVGPVLFGWLLDSGRPQGIFWSAVAFMVFTAVISLLQERRSGRSRSVAQPAGVR